jgi:hypothetical protein
MTLPPARQYSIAAPSVPGTEGYVVEGEGGA